MSRYNSSATIKDKTGKRRKASIILPVVPKSTEDIFIKTTTPERLDKLAFKFYDDSTLWWVIASANAIGKGTFIIPENTNLRIPSKAGLDDIIVQKNISR